MPGGLILLTRLPSPHQTGHIDFVHRQGSNKKSFVIWTERTRPHWWVYLRCHPYGNSEADVKRVLARLLGMERAEVQEKGLFIANGTIQHAKAG